MKALLTVFVSLGVISAHCAMTPDDIASRLAAAPSIEDLGYWNRDQPLRDQLLDVCVDIAKCDSTTIRAGLKLYDSRVDARNRTEVGKAYYNGTVLIYLLFQFPRGPARLMPPSPIWWHRLDDRKYNPGEDIEYSVPIEVGPDGIIRLAYRTFGYEGPPITKVSIAEAFERFESKYPRRKIDFEKQPKHTPEPTPPSVAPAAR